MKRHLLLVFCLISIGLAPTRTFAQTQLIKNLQAGKKQTLVVYGTSLSVYKGGIAWVTELSLQLNKEYHNQLTVYDAAKSAMWSTWGVQNLEDSVIKRNPDAVLIEFSMNDAFLPYKTSPELARLNLNYMIDRILLANPDCEVILQIMNIPINKNAELRPNLQAYLQVYRDVVRKRGLLLIDHSHYWQKILDKGKDEYLKHVPDGIHPDEKSGRELIAPYILRKLKE